MPIDAPVISAHSFMGESIMAKERFDDCDAKECAAQSAAGILPAE